MNPQYMHIVNGDSAAGLLQTAFGLSPDQLVVSRDVLSCGPIEPFVDLSQWRTGRWSFWRQVCAECAVDFAAIELTRDLYEVWSEMDGQTECVVWLGEGLSDQLMLAFLVQLFDLKQWDLPRLLLCQFQQAATQPKAQPVVGIPLLRPEQVNQHPPFLPLDEAQAKTARRCWQAYSATSPEAYLTWLDAESAALPLMRTAMSVLRFRYPDADSGLSQWDQLLLQAVNQAGPQAHQVIGACMAQEHSSLDPVGDLYLFHRLQRLGHSNLKAPLVRLRPGNQSMRETNVELTDAGHQVLDGEVSHLTLNGCDDHIGGVHLNKDTGQLWLREQDRIFQQS